MSNKMQQHLPLVFVITLAIVLASVMTFSVASVASADNVKPSVSSLSIGQFSDIHYFPVDECYQDINNDNYKKSDFYYSMTGDTKLVMESGMILKQQIEAFIADAKAGTAPQYVFATGDLSKNGEVKALVDVANALRYLQNTVRALGGKYANFQVFATPGNHDLYNTSGALYSKDNGAKRTSDALSAMQFALVFASLGYPDANLDGNGGAIKLTDYLPENYWYGEYTTNYIPSTNAPNLELTYFNEHLDKASKMGAASTEDKLKEYYQIGDINNALTFSVAFKDNKDYSFLVVDASDRTSVDVGAYVRINRDEYEVIKANTQSNGANFTYYGATKEGAVDTSTTITPDFSSDDNVVFRSTGLDHLCGGRLTEPVLDWMQKFCNVQNAQATLGEATIVTCFHQNVLPHWEMEDEILKDFTIYNWENTAKRLLDMGVRYAFTGHMHVCDAMTYTDVEGRTLYDFQTGSCVSYYSPRRYTTLSRYNFDGKLGESCGSSVFCLDDLKDADGVARPFKEVPSHNVFTAPKFNDATFKTAYAEYKKATTEADKEAKWAKVVATNPDYLAYMINYDNMNAMNFNDYINEQIYSVLVERVADHFVGQKTIDSLVGTLTSAVDSYLNNHKDGTVVSMVFNNLFPTFSKKLNPEEFAQYGSAPMSVEDKIAATNGIVKYILDTVLNGATYVHNGKEYTSALSLVQAVVDEVFSWSYGDDSIKSTVNPANSGKMNIKDVAAFIMTAHTLGTEISLDETAESIKAIFGDEQKVEEGKNYLFMHPYNPTYRLRMVAAVKDMKEQLLSGKFVQDLFKTLLDPIFTEDGSLLKTVLNYKFDFKDAASKGYISDEAFARLKKGLGEKLPSLLSTAKPLLEGYIKTKIDIPENYTIDAQNFVLVNLLNDWLPVIKSLAGNLLGFSLDGPDVVSIVQNFLDSYLVDSFYKGIGGIANDIVISFATDVYPDMDDFAHPGNVSYYQPNKAYEKEGVRLSYLSTLNKPSAVGATFNAATQQNGRVPSRVTANFDTANSTTSYTIKFYTEENVYGTFRLLDEKGNVIGEVGTSQAKAFEEYAKNKTDYLDVTAYKEFANGVKATVFTQTKPQYVPLIDLGLLCLTHGQIEREVVVDDKKVKEPIKYGERDSANANSVIYWNCTTVTVTGLKAGQTYYYDVLGNYGENVTFSLVDFVKTKGYTGNSLKFTTAPDRSVDTFEFLTVADIQGMIQSMYDESHKAVDALLKDEKVNNFDFILNAGDMCDNGKNFNQWSMALDTYQDLTLNSSMFFTAGNHENKTGSIGRFFNYTVKDGANVKPIENNYYSFDYANAHFTVLDTNDASSEGLGKAQLEWLENDLKNTDAKWKFVLMHKSLYSAGSHAFDSEVIAMRSQLTALFAKYNVNMVFGGHDHTYTTTYLLDGNGKIVDKTSKEGVIYNGKGTLYVTLGTFGTKYYTYKKNDMTTKKFDKSASILHTLDTQTFGKVSVKGNTITYTGYYYNPETNTIEQIYNKDNKLMIILLSTLIPGAAIIGVGTGLGIHFAKKKKAKLNA